MEYELTIQYPMDDITLLVDAIDIAFKGRHSKVAGFKEEIADDGKTYLVFYWHEKISNINLFAATPSVPTIASTIEDWLRQQDIGHGPDTDGSVEEAWRFKSGWLGKFKEPFYAVFAVRKDWIIHGK